MDTSISRFTKHYVMYQPRTSDEQEGTRLVEIMSKRLGVDTGFFDINPSIPLVNIENDSVVFVFGEAVNLYLPLQASFPEKNVSVVCINSPYRGSGDSKKDNGRVALYSSVYPPILGQCDWKDAASQAYDLPWLQHGFGLQKYAMAYLLTSYMKQEDISQQVHSFEE